MERIGSETLLERAVRVAHDAQLGPTLVVINPLSPEVHREAERLQCDVVFNHEAKEGMASSIRAGVSAVVGKASAVILMTCDQPAVSSPHLRALTTGELSVVASSYAGRRGVPAYFLSQHFETLLHLSGDAGARELLQSAEAIELEDGDLDVDTWEELERARRLFVPSQV